MLNPQRAGLIIIGATLAGLAAACGPDTAGAPITAHPVAAAATSSAPIAPAAPVRIDPLKSDGMWLVGSDIQPGTYRVTPTGTTGGYWALCSDLTCEVGAGLIRNDFVTGPSFVLIPATAKAIQLSDVTLAPAPN